MPRLSLLRGSYVTPLDATDRAGCFHLRRVCVGGFLRALGRTYYFGVIW